MRPSYSSHSSKRLNLTPALLEVKIRLRIQTVWADLWVRWRPALGIKDWYGDCRSRRCEVRPTLYPPPCTNSNIFPDTMVQESQRQFRSSGVVEFHGEIKHLANTYYIDFRRRSFRFIWLKSVPFLARSSERSEVISKTDRTQSWLARVKELSMSFNFEYLGYISELLNESIYLTLFTCRRSNMYRVSME